MIFNSLDPTNTRAREGKERVEKHNDVGLESTYDLEDMEGSDNDVSTGGSHYYYNFKRFEILGTFIYKLNLRKNEDMEGTSRKHTLSNKKHLKVKNTEVSIRPST